MERKSNKENVVSFYRCAKCKKQYRKECPATVAYCETMVKCPSCKSNLEKQK
jgi:hypothetical protein